MAVKNATKDGAATVLLQFIAGMSILILAPVFKHDFPVEPRYWLLLVVACVFYALNDRLQTTARKHLPVSTYSIVNQFTNVFLILIGILVFEEPIVAVKLLGGGLILLANILLIYKQGAVKVDKYIWITILATLAFSIAISVDIGISKQFNLPFYIMLTLAIPAFMAFFGEGIKKKELVDEYKSGPKNWYFVAGKSWGLAILFSFRSFRFGDVTTVVPLQATAVLLNVLAAYIFLHERDNKLKKIVAALLVIAGDCFTVL